MLFKVGINYFYFYLKKTSDLVVCNKSILEVFMRCCVWEWKSGLIYGPGEKL